MKWIVRVQSEVGGVRGRKRNGRPEIKRRKTQETGGKSADGGIEFKAGNFAASSAVFYSSDRASAASRSSRPAMKFQRARTGKQRRSDVSGGAETDVNSRLSPSAAAGSAKNKSNCINVPIRSSSITLYVYLFSRPNDPETATLRLYFIHPRSPTTISPLAQQVFYSTTYYDNNICFPHTTILIPL